MFSNIPGVVVAEDGTIILPYVRDTCEICYNAVCDCLEGVFVSDDMSRVLEEETACTWNAELLERSTPLPLAMPFFIPSVFEGCGIVDEALLHRFLKTVSGYVPITSRIVFLSRCLCRILPKSRPLERQCDAVYEKRRCGISLFDGYYRPAYVPEAGDEYNHYPLIHGFVLSELAMKNPFPGFWQGLTPAVVSEIYFGVAHHDTSFVSGKMSPAYWTDEERRQEVSLYNTHVINMIEYNERDVISQNGRNEVRKWSLGKIGGQANTFKCGNGLKNRRNIDVVCSPVYAPCEYDGFPPEVNALINGHLGCHFRFREGPDELAVGLFASSDDVIQVFSEQEVFCGVRECIVFYLAVSGRESTVCLRYTDNSIVCAEMDLIPSWGDASIVQVTVTPSKSGSLWVCRDGMSVGRIIVLDEEKPVLTAGYRLLNVYAMIHFRQSSWMSRYAFVSRDYRFLKSFAVGSWLHGVEVKGNDDPLACCRYSFRDWQIGLVLKLGRHGYEVANYGDDICVGYERGRPGITSVMRSVFVWNREFAVPVPGKLSLSQFSLCGKLCSDKDLVNPSVSSCGMCNQTCIRTTCSKVCFWCWRDCSGECEKSAMEDDRVRASLTQIAGGRVKVQDAWGGVPFNYLKAADAELPSLIKWEDEQEQIGRQIAMENQELEDDEEIFGWTHYLSTGDTSLLSDRDLERLDYLDYSTQGSSDGW